MLTHKILLLALAILPLTTSAQQQYIDQFTGDFVYNVPLLSVSGPNGEQFPLVANYRSGIRTNQEASWIGLGWNLNIGSISRSVNGVPDDWKGVNVRSDTLKSSGGSCSWDPNEYIYNYYGPIYFKDFPGVNQGTAAGGTLDAMDIYTSDRLMNTSTPFEYPDYDAYYVSGPGMGGEVSPFLFDYGTLEHKDNGDFIYSNTQLDARNKSGNFAQTPQFKFKNEPVTQVFAPYYCGGCISDQGLWQDYTAMTSNNVTTLFKSPQNIDTATSNQYFYSGDYDTTTNRGYGGHYIEYFTNAEIENHHDGGGNEITGFLEFTTIEDRGDTTDFPSNGIGAYRVTTPSGMVYHYSLPVYNNSDLVYTFDLTPDFQYAGAWDNLERDQKNEKYASSWLLTAITGPNYEDVNSNGIADSGDYGYWITLNYTQWWDDFDWKSPFFGYEVNLKTKRQKNNDVFTDELQLDYYETKGNVTEGNSEQWYLNTIQTATQTAFFVKEVRLDNHSTDDKPRLKLSKIVMLDNDDLSLFPTTQDMDDPTSGSFTLPTDTNALNTTNMVQYNANKTAIEAAALKIVDFDQDYSLAQNLYNNINSNYSTTNKTISHQGFSQVVYKEISSITDVANSGKLTLNEIEVFENGHEKIFPSYLFDYNESDDAVEGDNPDYNHRRKSFFGYYNSTNAAANVHTGYIQRGGYIDSTSAEFVDAWNLRTITSPLGASLEIEYEADRYGNIGYDSHLGYPPKPTRIFLIKAMDFGPPDTINKPQIVPYDNAAIGLYSEASETGIFYFYDCSSGSCTNGTRSASAITLVPNQTNDTLEVTGGISSTICDETTCSGPYYTPNDVTRSYAYLKYTFDEVYGGGSRVKTISTREQPTDDEAYVICLDYEGGIATTEPDRFAPAPYENILRASRHGADRHALAPNVGYSTVILRQKHQQTGQTLADVCTDTNNYAGKTVTEFQNYSEPFNPAETYVNVHKNPGTTNHRVERYEVTSVTTGNYLYGHTIRVNQYDSEDKLIAYTYNEYQDDREQLGRTEEVFYRGMHIDNTSMGDVDYIFSVFYKIHLSSILKRVTNYQDGIITVMDYVERDTISGLPTQVKVDDLTNGITYSHTTYAYGNTGIFGSKCIADTNYNMLGQVETQKTYRNGTQNAYLEAGVHTNYNDTIPTRKFSGGAYTTVNEADIPMAKSASVFNGQTNVNNWKYTGEQTLYSERRHILEQKGIDNTFAATRYDCFDLRPIAEAANANFASFTYSGFEHKIDQGSGTPLWFTDGELEMRDGTQLLGDGTNPAHTGSYLLKLTSGSDGPIFKTVENDTTINGEVVERGLQPGRTYRASVWIWHNSDTSALLKVHLNGTHTGGGTIDIQKQAKLNDAIVTSGNWRLLAINFTVPNDYQSSGSTNNDLRIYLDNNSGSTTAWFDDFRFHPVDAAISTFGLDDKRGLLLFSLDQENFYTRFLYDAAGRRTHTYIETEAGEELLEQTNYHFARGL